MLKGYILFFLLIGSTFSSDSFDFSYSKDGSPPDWQFENCSNGTKQSPINIMSDKVERVKMHDLKFDNYNVPIGPANIVNNGHTINIHNLSKEMKVDGGILHKNEKYILDQIHFHWPSEHTFDNKRYSLEMHLVHYEDNYHNISDAQKYKDGLLVVAVVFMAGAENNTALEKIFNNNMIENINDHTELNKNFKISGDFTLRDLMPAELDDNYYYYSGSLTTPPCTESVRWIVFEDLQTFSLDQLEVFKDIEDRDGTEIKNNNRNTQKVGGRSIFYVIDDEGSKDNKEDLNRKNDVNDDGKDDDDNDEKDDDDEKDNDDKKDDDEKDDKKDDDDKDDDESDHNLSLRYSGNPIIILLTFIISTYASLKI